MSGSGLVLRRRFIPRLICVSAAPPREITEANNVLAVPQLESYFQ